MPPHPRDRAAEFDNANRVASIDQLFGASAGAVAGAGFILLLLVICFL